MTRRITLTLALMVAVAFAMLPGIASAQSPPVVAGTVVEAPAPAVSGGTLPRTGSSNVIPMSIGAVALLAAGGLLVVSARRRKGDDDGSVRLA